jgi:hypothetical protein
MPLKPASVCPADGLKITFGERAVIQADIFCNTRQKSAFL